MAAQPPPYDYLFKLLLIGDAGVGKSSLLLRFTDGTFDEHIQSTIGVDFKVKHATVEGKRVKLTVWDTAGQERFRTLTSSYYRGAQAVLLTYDVSRSATFENLETWLKEVDSYSPNKDSIVKVVVGNKSDLGSGQVSDEEAEAWAKERGMIFLKASAKDDAGVQDCFYEVVRKVLNTPELLTGSAPGRPRIKLQGAQAVLLTYDVSRSATFENLETWLKEVDRSVRTRKERSDDAPCEGERSMTSFECLTLGGLLRAKVIGAKLRDVIRRAEEAAKERSDDVSCEGERSETSSECLTLGGWLQAKVSALNIKMS
eukprot:CAMPEP_0197571302 /NCGR_PEP_ID=MMETSP1320-20131121/41885_1 /TAXON_ID=91990 /ORGANISM="Bolidomonas sp., Strain RCC2347" /LENGTH=313 /DNA_ID=CAMNT_0043133791 /DNA_START=562 /DNA_END=1503 /DNA_ORIENTATION=-